MDDHHDSGLSYPKVLYPYFPGYEDYRQECPYTSDENDRPEEADESVESYSTASSPSATSSSSATSSASSTTYKYKYKYKYKYGKTSTSKSPEKYTDVSSSSSGNSSSEQTPPRYNHLPAAYTPPASYSYTVPPPFLYPEQTVRPYVPPHLKPYSSTPSQYTRENEAKKYRGKEYNKKEQHDDQEKIKGTKKRTERTRKNKN